MQDRLKKEDLELIEIAKRHIKKSYSVDRITVGSVLRTKSGKIYTGVNVKYCTRSIGICAERLAMFKAIEAGDTEFDTIVAVIYYPETDTHVVFNSCGVCRQVAAYHAPINTIVNDKSNFKLVPIENLLPYYFT
jgi:cytidine deaminase